MPWSVGLCSCLSVQACEQMASAKILANLEMKSRGSHFLSLLVNDDVVEHAFAMIAIQVNGIYMM